VADRLKLRLVVFGGHRGDGRARPGGPEPGQRDGQAEDRDTGDHAEGGPVGGQMIGRLEQHGLVERSLCDNDRRGTYVCLTGAGHRRHAEALPTQRAVHAATLQVGRATGH
jgi:hypothetical protein